eukprot:TRINITY_DN23166_c1_g3_i1.p1 TRINITY_DN23166_c1_g3~~TRINITY_DN23166_c1_g3_i1.p1  ORF type:complete len:387 (+),score=86.22 TRINITY_DN23166_c1_g3_i1:69-1163(+)
MGAPARPSPELLRMKQRFEELRASLETVLANESLRGQAAGTVPLVQPDTGLPGARWGTDTQHSLFVGEERKDLLKLEISGIDGSLQDFDQILSDVTSRIAAFDANALKHAMDVPPLRQHLTAISHVELQDPYKKERLAELLRTIATTPQAPADEDEDVALCLQELSHIEKLQNHLSALDVQKAAVVKACRWSAGQKPTAYSIEQYVRCERGWRAEAAQLESLILEKRSKIASQLSTRRLKFEQISALLEEVSEIDAEITKEDLSVHDSLDDLTKLDARTRRFLGAMQTELAGAYVGDVLGLAEGVTSHVKLEAHESKNKVATRIKSALPKASQDDVMKLKHAAAEVGVSIQPAFFEASFSGLET